MFDGNIIIIIIYYFFVWAVFKLNKRIHFALLATWVI